ncbi:hypothetical protein SLEP1_g8490 [Rubroshorea leprosula]|uniref:RING-type E3 ubiquitin transferase n=1 Tax=Rubroshorea leprosula TaxID=152421 RepID=A0AAV5IB47_9ROSI|nr:hypothetical protein SLEP1_g8490 [Rubroshorea leprosula]
MASVSYLHLHLHDPDDDVVVHHHSRPDQTLTLDPIPYWSHEFHFFSSDPDEFSFPDALVADGLDLLDDRENQVNFVIDLLHQRVEQSQVISDGTTSSQNNNRVEDDNDNGSNDTDDSNAVDLVSDALTDLGFGVIDGTHELDVDDLELDLGLGFGSVETHYGNSGFVVETIGGSDVGGDDDDDDDFLVERSVERRVSPLASSGAASAVGGVEVELEPRRESVRLVRFESDSEDDDNGALAIDLNSVDEYGMDHVDGYDDEDDDASVTIPLRLDSFQLEDRGETNEDEWEEVYGDEREVFSVHYDDENSVSVSLSSIIAQEDAASVERASGIGNFGWQVLLHSNNVETNPEMGDNAELYFGDPDDYIHTSEYEMFGQFLENENAFLGRPPASKSVVENLPSVVVTKEDVDCNNAQCAVCKDEINIGEEVKQLPCAHRYHGDCIIPWLGIRNTCPVCRHELPTDDAEYERRRTRRAGRAGHVL